MENLIAALIGGFSSSLRFHKQGYIQMLRVFISSAALGFFGGDDLCRLILDNTDILINSLLVYFLLSYCGSTLLDRAILFLKAFRVSKKWDS